MLAALAVGSLTDTGSMNPGGTASAQAATGPALITLRHRPSSFTVQAPRGFVLRTRDGVYVLKERGGGRSMSFSRSVTSVTPTQFGAALLKQLGGRVASRRSAATRFSAQVDRGSRRETVVVLRQGKTLAVITASAPKQRPIGLSTVNRVGASARGGVSLRSAPAAPAAMALVPYRTPDGGATAMVPGAPGWDITGGGGTVQGSSPRGAFLFGYSTNVLLPESAPPGTPPETLVSPYLNAADALTQLFPRVATTVSDIRIPEVIRDAVLPSFTSSAMYRIAYRQSGRPWTGVVIVGTDSPDRYSNFLWNMYYSGIGVPVGADPAVGLGLVRAWNSWDPSGAIAQRSAAAKVLIQETNDVWKQTMEFRGRIADQQARDVGCLIQGYYRVEDNARKYELPPLPCGQVYTERRP